MNPIFKKIYKYIPFKRSIYRAIPFKKFLFLLCKHIYKPPRNVYKYLYFIGNFKVKVDTDKSFKIKHYGLWLENEIFWNGIYDVGWEKYSLRCWKELCERSDTIFDIGANTGIYSLLAKTINEQSKVYAFEPVKKNFEMLELNVKLNSFNIKCVRKAVSNYDGKATIYAPFDKPIYSVTVNRNLYPNETGFIPTEIETIKLDTFIKIEGIKSIDLIKIDVETHEVEVLEGFKEYIKIFNPTLLIEILNDDIAVGVEKIISGIEYLFFNIDENSGIRQVQKLSKSDTYNFLICKPEIAERLNILK